jgi:hypothetical protein
VAWKCWAQPWIRLLLAPFNPHPLDNCCVGFWEGGGSSQHHQFSTEKADLARPSPGRDAAADIAKRER